jgi:hypothetical protein
MNGQSRTRRRAGGGPGLSYISTLFIVRNQHEDPNTTSFFKNAKPASDRNLTFLRGETDLINWNLFCGGKSGTGADLQFFPIFSKTVY